MSGDPFEEELLFLDIMKLMKNFIAFGNVCGKAALP